MPTMPHNLSRLLLVAVLSGTVAGAVLVAPVPAVAQDVDARLESMLLQAIDDYDVLMLEDAESGLEEALALARRHNVSGPVVAKLYVMLGIVRYALTRDEGLTEEAFVQGLEANPAVVIERVYQTPTLDGIFDRARRRARPPAPPTTPPADPPGDTRPADTPVAGATQLQHTPVRRASAGQSVLFEAFVPESLPVFRIYLHHRRFGEDTFARAEMLPTSATRFAHSLDARDVRTSQIDYYIEAVDRAGAVLATSGQARTPHSLVVLGSGAVAEDDTVRPPAGSGDPAGRDPAPELPDEPSKIGYYAIVSIGSDLGFLPGGVAPTANVTRDVSPGLAPAFAHTMIDLGVMLTPSAHLGLYFRWQFSPEQDFSVLPPGSVDSGAGFWNTAEECFGTGLFGDCMLGLKYRWVFARGTPEFYSSVGGGIGRMRNWLRLKESGASPFCDGKERFRDPAVGEYCYVRDTVRTGWAHFGVGGGMNFPLTTFMDLTADTYLMFLVPDTSINLDLSLGLRFRI